MSLCVAYCEHGGACILEAGHEGLHDTKYCQFEVSEDKAIADALVRGNGYPQALIDLEDIFRTLEKALEARNN